MILARHGLVGRTPRHPTASRTDTGAVTAELAVAFAAVAFVLAVALSSLSVVLAQLHCVDAARAAARVAARGESPAAVEFAARERAPAGAVITTQRDATTVRVSVSASVAFVAPLPSYDVSAVAVAAVEGLS
ncbi:MAG: hypothetical protein JWM93_1121 [Frankiales bacterium]|nr:hypothetical protein [Frankiales bacterium]